jgi:hypothetical protein
VNEVFEKLEMQCFLEPSPREGEGVTKMFEMQCFLEPSPLGGEGRVRGFSALRCEGPFY